MGSVQFTEVVEVETLSGLIFEIMIDWTVSRGRPERYGGPQENRHEREYPEAEIVSATKLEPPGSFLVPRGLSFDEIEALIGAKAMSRLYDEAIENALRESEEDFNDRAFDEMRDRELFDL